MAKIQAAFCLLVALTVMLQVDAGYLYPRKELYGKSSIPEHTKHAMANVPISCFYLWCDSRTEEKENSNCLWNIPKSFKYN